MLKRHRQEYFRLRTITVTCDRPFKVPVGSWVGNVCIIVHCTKFKTKRDNTLGAVLNEKTSYLYKL